MLRKILITLVGGMLSIFGLTKAFSWTECSHPYFDIGATAYYLMNPDFTFASKGTTGTTPLGKINDNGFAPELNTLLGYKFYNDHDNILTKYFGHENFFELKFDYFNTDQDKRRNNLGVGNLWYIDGSGNYTITPPINFVRYKVRAKHQLLDFGLYFKGQVYTNINKLTVNPFFGVIHTDFNERYDLYLDYDDGGDLHYDHENYNVQSQYYGLSFGNQINWALNRRLHSFLKVELQLLHAEASLNAHQNADIEETDPPLYYKNATNSIHKNGTYRAIATVGLDYAFSDKLDAAKVSLKVGYDRWGFNPQIVTPNNAQSSAAHLRNSPQNNGLIALELHVPIY